MGGVFNAVTPANRTDSNANSCASRRVPQAATASTTDQFRRVVRLTHQLIGAPITFCAVVRGSELSFAASEGLGVNAAAPSLDLVDAIADGTVDGVCTDLGATQLEALSRFLGRTTIRFFAACPLVGPEGVNLGFLAVADAEPRILSSLERQSLQDIAALTLASVTSPDAPALQAARGELEFQKALRVAQSESSIDGILVVDSSNRIISSNRQFRDMWGIPAQTIDAGDERAALRAVLGALVEPREFLKKVEFLYSHPDLRSRDEIRLKDGRTFDRYSAPIQLAAGPSSEATVGRIWFFRDITDRKRAEEAVRSVTANARCILWDAIVRASDEGFAWELRIPDPTAAQRVLPLDLTTHERYEDAWFESKLAEDLPRMGQLAATSLRQGRTGYQQEFRCRRIDGVVRWLREVVSILPLGDGQWRLVGVCTDVTDQHRADEVRAKLDATLMEQASLLDLTNDMIVVFDIEGRILFWNLGAENKYGWALGEVLGKRFSDIVHPQQSAPFADLIDDLIRDGHWEGEAVHLTRDGRPITVQGRLALRRNPRGEPLAVMAIFLDITEAKQAADRISHLARNRQLILNSVGDGIVGLDRDGVATFINPAGARMLGYEVEGLIGKQLHELFHQWRANNPTVSESQCRICASLQDSQIYRVSNEVFWRQDGTSFPVEYLSTPIVERERVTGVVLSFNDITERRAVERMKDEFISVVSHELRTPLTSIRGSLGLLASGVLGPLPERGQRMLDIAVNNTDRLVRLINDILDIERIESGRVSMEKRACEAAELVAQAVDVMAPVADKAQVSLLVSPCSAPLLADSDRIVQVLTNLLNNAIKFSDPGKRVWLSASIEQDQLMLRVKDEGRGIPADKLDAIFERFQQVDASDAREKGGTGLGLAICRTIVQQHGGRIWAESTVGEGSTFNVTLPLLPRSEQQPDVPSAAAASVDQAASRFSRLSRTILLCDDDLSVLAVVGTLLEGRGFRVIKTSTGDAAVRAALGDRPDVILLDVVMPDQDGWQTLVRLKALPETRDIPVIILSALNRFEGEATHPDALDGVAEWVTKSVGEDSLVQAVDRILDTAKKTPRVLIVEDDADLARVLATMFQRHGIETFHALSGREAIALSQRSIPDLLVLDLVLPDGDGYSVVDWLKQHDRLHFVPLVVYTARDLDETDRERLRLGETNFLTKGRIPPEQFEKRVIQLLNRMFPGMGEDTTGNGETSSDNR